MAAIKDIYFSGQGEVYVGVRDSNGNAKVLKQVGNVPELRIQFQVDVVDHKESRTGQRILDFRLNRQNSARITMVMENFRKENFSLLFKGVSTNITSASVTNEAFPTGLVVGDYVNLNYPDVSAVSISDNASGTLVAGTNYALDAKAGIVEILSLGSFVQPFKANYTYAAAELTRFFKDSTSEIYMKFVGLNTANNDKRVTVELYRISFDPTQQFDLIQDDIARFQLEGSVLYDATRDADATLGGFGRIIQSVV